jgi:hypothetical protein
VPFSKIVGRSRPAIIAGSQPALKISFNRPGPRSVCKISAGPGVTAVVIIVFCQGAVA